MTVQKPVLLSLVHESPYPLIPIQCPVVPMIDGDIFLQLTEHQMIYSSHVEILVRILLISFSSSDSDQCENFCNSFDWNLLFTRLLRRLEIWILCDARYEAIHEVRVTSKGVTNALVTYWSVEWYNPLEFQFLEDRTWEGFLLRGWKERERENQCVCRTQFSAPIPPTSR